MEESELYISISPAIYRSNKSKILLNKIAILNTIKKLHNLKILAGQKADLKKDLKGLLGSTISQIDLFLKKMPKPKVPESIHIHEEVKIKKQVSPPKRNEMEEELQQIQAKLQELNG